MARKFSWILPAALMLLLSQLSACRHEYKATAPLPDGGSATLAVRDMFGPGSDWHRRLLIRTAADPDHPLSVDLFPDGGWWRGSNLYFLAPGHYVLHEGQEGCVAFTTHPRPAMITATTKGPAYSCDKAAAPGLVRASGQHGLAASRFYRGLFFIGHFAETSEGEPVQFITAEKLAEPELPDTM